VSTVISGIVPLSTVTTQGDLIVATGAGAVTRLGVGSSGQILTSNGTTPAYTSTVTGTLNNGTLTGTLTAASSAGTSGQLLSSTGTGVQWVAAPAAGSMTLLNGPSGTALSGTSTTVSSISQSYRNMFVTISNYYSASTNLFSIQANGNNYSERQFTSTISTYTQINSESVSNVAVNNNSVFLLYNYSDTTISKAYMLFGDDAPYGVVGGAYFGTGLINTLSGISSLTFSMNSGTFAAGTVKIYGVN
jgi:hypothetical protein